MCVVALAERGRHSEALARCEEVLERYTEMYGVNHPETLKAKRNVGTTLLSLERYPEARGRLEEALAGFRAIGEPDDEVVDISLRTMGDLSGTLSQLGRHTEALVLQ